MSKKYLQTFFKEKQLSERTYDIEHNGTLHMVESKFVIELLTKSASKEEQAQATDIIRKIDFMNGDVHHFLQHLATGYVKTNF